eukprot:2742956-Amphidinium_carterae.1
MQQMGMATALTDDRGAENALTAPTRGAHNLVSFRMCLMTKHLHVGGKLKRNNADLLSYLRMCLMTRDGFGKVCGK